MTIKFFTPIIGLLLINQTVFSQKSPYTIKHSSEFVDSKGVPLWQTNACANGDVLLTFAKGEKLDKVGFQYFTSDLSLGNSNMPNIKSLFSNKKSYLESVIVMNKKSYVFVKEVYKETKTEGISAVEFSTSTLDVTGEPKKLFESSRGVYGYGCST